jgi:FTR1 family protein
MYATALIVFREVLEAGLIIGIVLAATRGIPSRGRWVASGVIGGLLAAVATAGLADQIMAAMEGMGQEIFNASVLMIAVVMLGWHSIWMQKHGRELAGKLRSYGDNVASGDSHISILAVVISLAVLREGAEVVLFLHGIAASGDRSVYTMLFGGLLGITAGAATGLAIYHGLLHIPQRYLFMVTTWLIVLLAAGMAAQAAHYLEMASILPSLGGSIWNTSAFLSDSSLIGQVLHILIGYTARPDAVQLVAYITTLLVIFSMNKVVNRRLQQTAIRNTSAVAGIALAGMLLGFNPQTAEASHKVYSPHVDKGELEIEYRGHVDIDRDDEKDGARKDKYEIGYGFTDWWFSSLFFEFEKEGDEDYRHEATAWENIFQITEAGRFWLDAGLYFEYEVPEESDHADKVEFKLLLEKYINRWDNILNLVAETEVGSDSSDEVEFGYAWGTYYRYKPAFEPGFELYGELGSDNDFGIDDDQTHQAGPVIEGSFRINPRSKLAYNVGYLLGLTDESPNGTFKWTVEWETHF